MAQWYYQIDGQTHGPISDRKFKRRVATGMLRPSDLVCRDGMKDWVTIASLDLMNEAAEECRRRSKSRTRKHTSTEGSRGNSGASRKAEVSPPPRPLPVVAPPPVRVSQTDFKRPVRKSDRRVLVATFIALSMVFLAVLVWAIVSSRDGSTQTADAQAETQPEKRQVGPVTEGAKSKKSEVKAAANIENAGAVVSKRIADEKTGSDDSTTPADDTVANNSRKSDSPPKAGTSDVITPAAKELAGAATDSPAPENKADKGLPSKQPSQSQAAKYKAAKYKAAEYKTDTDKKRIGLQDTGVVVLYQEMDVARSPKFIVQGLPFDQELHYRVLSEFRIGKLQENGSRSVEQTVIAAKLISADALSRAAMGEAVTNLKGQTFRFKLNQLQEVEDFAAGKEEKKSIKIKNPFDVLNTEGFRVTSVIDQDGWKELAQVSFFVPRDQQKTWVGQMRHDWDALGSWEGETTYQLGAEQKNMLTVNYAHKMKYTPPEAGGGGGGLPFEIGSANFTPQTAGGSIQYDQRAGRVASVQENFHVTGELDADVLGQKAKIQVAEQQVFTLRLLDQNPWQQ